MTNRILVDKDTGQEFEVVPQGGSLSLCVLNEIKPEPKVIDWSKVSAEANIPAMFWSEGASVTSLTAFFNGTNDGMLRMFRNERCRDYEYDKCTLVTGIPVPWFGGECPLPEGVLVSAFVRYGSKVGAVRATRMRWDHSENNTKPDTKHGDIIAFEITGLEDGYVWNKGE